MIEINGKVYRNLQEQVEKNAEDIQDRYDKDEIAALLYGKVDKSDIGYIEVTSTSGDLTDDQYAECSKEYCILCSVSGNQKTYYYKYNQTSSSFLFKRFPTTNGGYDNYVYFTDAYFTVDSNKYYSRNLFDYNLQKELISGTNIKTINNESLLGSGNLSIQGTAVVTITGNSSTGTFTQEEYDLLYNSNVSFIKFNTTMYYRDWNADLTDSMDFKTIPFVSTTIPNYRFEQKHIRVHSDRTWEHATIRKDYAKENIGIIDMGANTDTDGTLTSTQLSYLTQNTVSIVIKNGLYYYRAESSYNTYYYRSLPEITYNLDGTTTQTYKLFSVNTTSNEWSDRLLSFTAELPMQEFVVYFEFAKTGTGAANYSVYFNLKAKRNKYSGSNLSFSQLRSLIIANGNHVECSCQTQGTLDMNIISTSENAGDPTILVDSKTGDFFEFYSFSDLTNYSITELTY